MSLGNEFEKLIEIIEALRGEGGCPWDREQTPETVKRYLVEEAYEAVSEVEKNNIPGIMEELGDLIFMSLFMAYLFQQDGKFTIEDVLRKAASKMIHRHPHVFGNQSAKSAEEVKKNWERLKKEEKNSKKLDIPRNLPALMRAHRLAGRAWKITCPSDEVTGLVSFITERMGRIKDLLDNDHPEERGKNLGRILLAMVCLARKLNINAEDALHSEINAKLD